MTPILERDIEPPETGIVNEPSPEDHAAKVRLAERRPRDPATSLGMLPTLGAESLWAVTAESRPTLASVG